MKIITLRSLSLFEDVPALLHFEMFANKADADATLGVGYRLYYSRTTQTVKTTKVTVTEIRVSPFS